MKLSAKVHTDLNSSLKLLQQIASQILKNQLLKKCKILDSWHKLSRGLVRNSKYNFCKKM